MGEEDDEKRLGFLFFLLGDDWTRPSLLPATSGDMMKGL